MPVLFQLNGVLPANRYLLGHYRWSYAVRLTRAWLAGIAPSVGSVTVGLEVGGVLVPDAQFTCSGPGEVLLPLARNVLVPANTLIRWKVVEFDPPVEDAAMAFAITLESVAQSVAGTVPVPLTVGWVNGGERLNLFTYDPGVHTFAEAFAGVAAGRARIAQNGDTSIAFFLTGTGGEVEALRVVGGVCYVPALTALGGTATKNSPRLEFLLGGGRIASLTATELLVPDVAEAVTMGSAGFDFYSGGQLTARLTLPGLGALAVTEGIP